MGEIKSALEIALERTNSVKSDKTLIIKQNAEEEGKKLGARFLSDTEPIDTDTLKEIIKKTGSEELPFLKKGISKILLSYLKLPVDGIENGTLNKIREGLILLSDKKKEITYIFSQIEAFFSQYIQNRQDLTESLKHQFSSRLHEKEELLKEQLGKDVHIRMEDDREYQEHLHKAVSRLKEQYSQAFAKVKEELSEYCL